MKKPFAAVSSFARYFSAIRLQNKAERLLPQMAAHVETFLLPDKLFASAVPSETPQGVAALVRCKQFSIEEVLAKSGSGPIVAVAGVQDPGNLGTILRSAEAFGAGGVLLGEGTVGPFNSKVVRGIGGFSISGFLLQRRNLAKRLTAFGQREFAS